MSFPVAWIAPSPGGRGQWVWVTDSDGKQYLEASGGPLVVNLGHCYRSTGLAGTEGDALVIGPPFVIEPEEMDRVVDALGRTVESVLA